LWIRAIGLLVSFGNFFCLLVSPWCLLVSLGCVLCAFWCLVGASWLPLGCLLLAPWCVLGVSWCLLVSPGCLLVLPCTSCLECTLVSKPIRIHHSDTPFLKALKIGLHSYTKPTLLQKVGSCLRVIPLFLMPKKRAFTLY